MKYSPENTPKIDIAPLLSAEVIVTVGEVPYTTRAFTDNNGNKVVFTKDETPETEYQHISPRLEELLTFAAEQYNDDNLRNAAKKIHQKQYDVETDFYADILAAALLINANYQPNKDFNDHAIEDFFAFCSGDADIVQSLLERSLHLEDLYEQRKSKVYEQNKRHSEEFGRSIELDPKDIVLVHVTNHEPVLDDTGSVILLPTGYYEDFARGTIHFTVNSIVKHHPSAKDANTWQGKDRYIIVANLADILAQGSVPTLVHGVDTYFAVSPGEKLVLHNPVIIHNPDIEVDEVNKQVEKVIQQKGAVDVFTAGPHYLEGGTHMPAKDFSNALADLAVAIGSVPGPLHVDTSESNLETAFALSSVEQSDIFVGTYLASPIEAIRWAMVHGQLPTLRQIPTVDDGIFN